MDLTTFDVTDHPAARPGAWLELIGPALPARRGGGARGHQRLRGPDLARPALRQAYRGA